jgi:hypothetical protein
LLSSFSDAGFAEVVVWFSVLPISLSAHPGITITDADKIIRITVIYFNDLKKYLSFLLE